MVSPGSWPRSFWHVWQVRRCEQGGFELEEQVVAGRKSGAVQFPESSIQRPAVLIDKRVVGIVAWLSLDVKKILVIDDEEWLREMVQLALRQKGFDVVEAENGAVGIEIARKELPDLILCDVNMERVAGS